MQDFVLRSSLLPVIVDHLTTCSSCEDLQYASSDSICVDLRPWDPYQESMLTSLFPSSSNSKSLQPCLDVFSIANWPGVNVQLVRDLEEAQCNGLHFY